MIPITPDYSEKTFDLSEIIKMLPGFNCRDCDYQQCADFAQALIEKKAAPESCRFLLQARFDESRSGLNRLLGSTPAVIKQEKFKGVIDGYIADFILKPLPDECSCREILYPFYHKKYKKGQQIRYRPLGCPIPHFARIIDEDKGLITVLLIGPCQRLENNTGDPFEDIGVCMVGGFIGMIEGQKPKVGATVRFIPDGCMMQKVHSGVVVQIEGSKAIIEGIDLKVWAPPEAIRQYPG